MTGTAVRASSRWGNLLGRYGGRPFLVAVATLNLITGIGAVAILAPLSFGADVDFLRRGAQGLLDGVAVADFVFTPLCALVAVPLALLPATAAAAVMTTLETLILLAGVALETRRLAALDRVLIAIAVLFAIPVVNELLLGQVTILIAAAIYPLRDHDGLRRGIPLGVALALVPKPLLLPLLAWMLVWRRQALAGAVATAAALTLVGLVLLGPAAYGDWFAALQGAGEVSRQGSFSLWTNGVQPWSVAVAGVIVVTTAAAFRHQTGGFVAALPAGVLLAPYSLMYALSILVLAIRPAFALAPTATRLLAIVVNPAVTLVPFTWTTGWLIVPWTRFASRQRAGSRADSQNDD